MAFSADSRFLLLANKFGDVNVTTVDASGAPRSASPHFLRPAANMSMPHRHPVLSENLQPCNDTFLADTSV